MGCPPSKDCGVLVKLSPGAHLHPFRSSSAGVPGKAAENGHTGGPGGVPGSGLGLDQNWLLWQLGEQTSE